MSQGHDAADHARHGLIYTSVSSDGHPYGTAHLGSSLTSLQPYDVKLFLDVPRTPSNIEAGNFMIDLGLLSPVEPVTNIADFLPSFANPLNGSSSVLARSRRPASLTYASPILDLAHKLSALPWYVIGWKKDNELIEVSMLEGAEFARGWKNIPNQVYVKIEADKKMQFYQVIVKIKARFQGLRYVLIQTTDDFSY